jgi:alkylation response protein AidB-like acyl-CoA dehydrogenase
VSALAYRAPVAELLFAMREGAADGAALLAASGVDDATLEAVLDEAGRFAAEVLAPLNPVGDRHAARLEGGCVQMAAGFQAAYRQYVEAGWGTLSAAPRWGGQGLPRLVWTGVQEMWKAANLSFSALPQLTMSAVEALQAQADDALCERWLAPLVAGRWTGAMALTEPQAGSDLSGVRTLATPHGDGSWRLHGEKCFITYADHDLAENVVTLVLARTPDAPPGTKGLTLFLVPRQLLDDQGRPGTRNALGYTGLEHKLGFHGAPTGTLRLGDDTQGACGWQVGPLHGGRAAMFVMMHDARFSVGLEGLGIAERARQCAHQYAQTRVQGRVAIERHPDVRRMLLTMDAHTEALRAFALLLAAARDRADTAAVALLTPVFKAWSTETGIAVADLCIQVHGGLGVIEDSGVPQLLRDARAAALYEGTTGIQAADFCGRQLARDPAGARALLAQWHAVLAELRAAVQQAPDAALRDIERGLARALEAAQAATEAVQAALAEGRRAEALAVSVPLLRVWGLTIGATLLARSALRARARSAAGQGDRAFLATRVQRARFHAMHLASAVRGLADTVREGAAACLDEAF